MATKAILCVLAALCAAQILMPGSHAYAIEASGPLDVSLQTSDIDTQSIYTCAAKAAEGVSAAVTLAKVPMNLKNIFVTANEKRNACGKSKTCRNQAVQYGVWAMDLEVQLAKKSISKIIDAVNGLKTCIQCLY